METTIATNTTLRPTGSVGNADTRSLLSRLNQALDENAILSRKYEESRAEFERHRAELNAEIEKLNTRITGRLKLLLDPREKLMREEYDRKFQDLTVDLRSERGKYTRELKALKERMSLCICGSLRR